jgi:hypothetical protein
MPAFTGLLLALIIGNVLQRQRNIVPWFSAGRLLVISAYALTGLVTFIVPREWTVAAVLLIWALATIPQTIVAVCFSVVMNAVAGPQRRYELMSRRWSTLGATTAITVALVGQILDRLSFPVNYQVVFMGLSLGGLISYYFSSHIELPETPPQPRRKGFSLKQSLRSYITLVRGEPAFVSFAAKRFVYLTGQVLASPLFPLYYVREVQASEAWIGIISTTQTAVLLVGYYLWTRQSKLRGSRYVLVRTTFGLALYPAIIAMTHRVELIALFAGLAGILQAGIDLVFFDELMKTVPEKYSALFVSLAQSLQYLSTVIAPLIGTLLADQIGIGGAMMVSGAVRMLGFALFALGRTGSGEGISSKNVV